MSIVAPSTPDDITSQDYFWLVETVKNWLHRSDLAARVPDFILLAESRINRLAKVRVMGVDAALVMTPGSRFVVLPADYVSPSALWLDANQPRTKLTPLVAEQMPVANNAGMPTYWAVDGTMLAFDRVPDQAYPLAFRYRARFKLTAQAPTNYLLERYPDLYLYGALLESAPFIGQDERIGLWKSMFDQAVQEINNVEHQSRSVGVLTTDVPTSMLSRRGRY
ncbi:Constituent protein [Janthinobacterium sp. CG23_2]|nr:hypothetical protein BN2497_9 [Janthinobacterium sp. CG23_2]CUI09429.1 Constituent protein [Janthinobacterium sp. CG23_2]CUU26402.1 hypothetical protein BN3177_9 [Janthinobacterium sp. CG23_2]CUU33215.1 Constituent protein [Janthinobacterium sp. CG23_2]